MVTHDLHEAFFLGDQISIIMDGKLRQQGNRETVYRKPNSREVANFLGVTNIFNITALQFKGDRRWVECPELGCQLALPFSKSETEAFQSCSAVGIRSEHLELTALASSSSANRVTGIIEEIHAHENAAMIRVRCGPAGIVLEAAVPLARLKEGSFFRGEPITLRLPEDYLFPLADPSSAHGLSLQ
jgi:ABC-type sugar transport system ATPase subunit